MADREAVHAHPYWFGPEVEGYLRLLRPYTVVLRSPCVADIGPILDRSPRHAFLTETFSDWDWLAHFCKQFTGPITAGVDATDRDRLVAIKRLPYTSRISVMLRYWGPPTFLLLDPKDQVSVGAPFQLATFRMLDGHISRPEDYEQDHA